ncbi:MAG: aldehyde dehydrogenase family protein, partial [Bacteroidia bacterium]
MSTQRPTFKPHYDNFIGGEFVAPVGGEYFENYSPIDAKLIAKAARSGKADIELALDAAHKAFATWSKTSPTYRASVLNKIADVMEANLMLLATIETIDNGKPIRETVNVDLPLCIDHFRYFAGVIRAEEGTISEHDENTV